MPQRSEGAPVAVVGAGPAGLAAALALSQAGLHAFVLDARPLPAPGEPLPAEGRTTALLEPALALLAKLGVWPALEPEAEPLSALRLVSLADHDAEPEADVTFTAAEIGLARFGCNLRVEQLRAALLERARAQGVRLLGGTALLGLRREEGALRLLHERGEERVALVVAADGRRSTARRALGIPARERPSGRTAIGLGFTHARPHEGVSIELHRPGGAFTMVPLPGRRSSLVWVEPDASARRLLALSDEAFRAELERRVGRWLGAVEAVGPRQAYPLVGMLARRLAAPRGVLVGEAAHALSPVGAQGLNTSLRDVATLADLVGEALARGRDPAAPDLLLAYERARLPDIRARFAVTEGLAAAIASAYAPVRLARTVGLRLIGAVPALRRRVMRGLIEPMALPLPLPLP